MKLKINKFRTALHAIRKSGKRSKAQQRAWENPSDAMRKALAAFQAAAQEWREEHPEEFADSVIKSLPAGKQWREKHPEWLALNLVKMRVGSDIWRDDYSEEFATNLRKAQDLAQQWRKGHPEEAIANSRKGAAAAHQWQKEQLKAGADYMLKWQKEHPETAIANIKKWQEAGKKWRAENPEIVRVRATIASKQWHKDHYEEVAANGRKTIKIARMAQMLRKKIRHEERLTPIKNLIPLTGMRYSELIRQCPQFTEPQLKCILNRAIRQGNLIKIRIANSHTRYYLPAEEKAA